MLCCDCYQHYVDNIKLCVYITLWVLCPSNEHELPKVMRTRSFESLDFPETLICDITVDAVISAGSVVYIIEEGISAVYGPVFIFDRHYILNLSN